MIEDELVKIWQSSPNQEQAKFEKSKLMIEVQSTLDRLHQKIRYRDLMEQLAVVLVSPVFAYYAYSIPFVLTKIASVLIILWGIYVIIRLQKAKKHKPVALTETYLEYLHQTREYLRVQKQLIDSVPYWYILPAALLMFLFILGPGLAGRLQKVLKLTGGIVALSVAIYWLNKRAVKKQLDPRLEKINKLIDVMKNP
jgi:hypothetical protein